MAAARPGASAAARRRRRAGLRVGLCWPKQRLRRRQEAGEGSGAGLAYRPGRAVRVDGLRVYACLAAGAFQYTVSTCTTKLHAGSMSTGSTSIACVPIGASTRRLQSTHDMLGHARRRCSPSARSSTRSDDRCRVQRHRNFDIFSTAQVGLIESRNKPECGGCDRERQGALRSASGEPQEPPKTIPGEL